MKAIGNPKFLIIYGREELMKIFKYPKLLSLIFSCLFISANAVADSDFSICGEGMTKCTHDSTAEWHDALSKIDYSTESVIFTPYDGIAIESNGAANNLTLYLKGYTGAGTYNLSGTEHTVWSASTNAVFSEDLAYAPYWVNPESPNGSYVEITKDDNNLISGIYKITVYFEGDSSNEPLNLEGEFTDVPKHKR